MVKQLYHCFVRYQTLHKSTESTLSKCHNWTQERILIQFNKTSLQSDSNRHVWNKRKSSSFPPFSRKYYYFLVICTPATDFLNPRIVSSHLNAFIYCYPSVPGICQIGWQHQAQELHQRFQITGIFTATSQRHTVGYWNCFFPLKVRSDRMASWAGKTSFGRTRHQLTAWDLHGNAFPRDVAMLTGQLCKQWLWALLACRCTCRRLAPVHLHRANPSYRCKGNSSFQVRQRNKHRGSNINGPCFWWKHQSK